jgi:hypothetical protein
VPHLLNRDVQDRFAPSLECFSLGGGDTLLVCSLQTKRRVEIAAHQRVLDLRGLGEKVQELLARANNDVRLGEFILARFACHRDQVPSGDLS